MKAFIWIFAVIGLFCLTGAIITSRIDVFAEGSFSLLLALVLHIIKGTKQDYDNINVD
jgi:hypothetical protein